MKERNPLWLLTEVPLKVLFGIFIGFTAISCAEKYDKRGGKMYYLGYPGGSYERKAYELVGADPRSFRVLETESTDRDKHSGPIYAVDANHAYRRHEVVEGADPATFRPVNENYSVDGTQVFYLAGVLPAADPQSFRLAGEYALDAGHVYLKNEVVEGADPRTFTALGYYWAKDANAVYRGRSRMEEISDPATFRHFGAVSQKRQSAFGMIFRMLFSEDGEDTSTLFMDDWACDKEHYYYRGHRIEGADYATFAFFDEGVVRYAKDRYHVFYCDLDENFIVEGADVETFEILGAMRQFARDRNRYYIEGRVISDEDAARVMEGKRIE